MNTQRILPIVAVLLLAAAAPALATVTVTVSSPANNATVPTTFNVVASATTDASGAQVTGWYIYVDSVAAWNTSGPTSTINASVTMSTGTHTVLVRAWDSTGAFGSQTLTLTASPSCLSGICVNVSSPTSGTTVGSPVHFTATAQDAAGNPITGYVVYVNNNNVYRNTISTLDAWVILNPGTYSFYIRAWDSTGAFGTSPTYSVTASGTVIPRLPPTRWSSTTWTTRPGGGVARIAREGSSPPLGR
jgi:large repetitive protein